MLLTVGPLEMFSAVKICYFIIIETKLTMMKLGIKKSVCTDQHLCLTSLSAASRVDFLLS